MKTEKVTDDVIRKKREALKVMSLQWPKDWVDGFWLVVSTHLKNMSQNGNLPQIGVKLKNIWNHHPDDGFCWENPPKKRRWNFFPKNPFGKMNLINYPMVHI